MDQIVNESLLGDRFVVLLFGVFASVALGWRRLVSTG